YAAREQGIELSPHLENVGMVLSVDRAQLRVAALEQRAAVLRPEYGLARFVEHGRVWRDLRQRGRGEVAALLQRANILIDGVEIALDAVHELAIHIDGQAADVVALEFREPLLALCDLRIEPFELGGQ